MKKLSYLAITLLALQGCTPSGTGTEQPKSLEPTRQQAPAHSVEPAEKGVWSVRAFSNTDGGNGFGFDVLEGEKIYVHQPTIPAVQGVRGFATEADAKACGELMLYKIRNGVLPPSVSVPELDSLGISH